MRGKEQFLQWRNSEIGVLAKEGAKKFFGSKVATVIAAIGIASTAFDTDRAIDAYTDMNLKESAIRSFYAESELVLLAGFARSMRSVREQETFIPLQKQEEFIIPLQENSEPVIATLPIS